jgi:hypothetical protein
VDLSVSPYLFTKIRRQGCIGDISFSIIVNNRLCCIIPNRAVIWSSRQERARVSRWRQARSTGQVKKSYRRRKLFRVSHVMRLETEDADPRQFTETGFLRTVEHSFYRASESDHAPWNSCAGSSYLGYLSTGSRDARPSGVVACLLPFCTSPCLATGEACAASRTRWQAGGATLPAADGSSGSRQNRPKMDRT